MIDQLIVISVVSVLLLVVAGAIRVRKQRPTATDPKPGSSDGLDTVAGWPPQATRVLTVAERNAYDLLSRALPGYMVFAQLPLSRFIKVPTRYSYAQWLRRVGNHCVDLVVADPLSRVIAVIEVRGLNAPDKSLRRHERVTRVLDTVGIPLHEWIEGELPSLAQVQALFNVNEAEAARVAHAHVHAQPVLALPPVDPATVTFYIANEALPEEEQQAAATTSATNQSVSTDESASMLAMMEGVPSRDTPPTTWYDEFDTPLPSVTLAKEPEEEDAAAEQRNALQLQYKPH